MEFSKPKRLISGQSTIGLIAPSGVADKLGLEEGIKILNRWGEPKNLDYLKKKRRIQQ